MVNYEFAAKWLLSRIACSLEIEEIVAGLKWLYCSISKAGVPVLIDLIHPAGTLDVMYLPAEHKQGNQSLWLQENADKLADTVIHIAITAILNKFLITDTEVLNIQFMGDEELFICLPRVSQQISDGLGLTFI